MWAMPVRRFKRLHVRVIAHRAAATLDMLESLSIANMSGNERDEAVSALQRRVTGEKEKIVTVSTADDFRRLIEQAKSAALRK